MRVAGGVEKTEMFLGNFAKVALTYDCPILRKVDLLTEKNGFANITLL